MPKKTTLSTAQLAKVTQVREVLLALPGVSEEEKWNAPSFKRTDHFATFNFSGKPTLRLVLHRGAKSKAPAKRLAVDDPGERLEWLGTDRAMLSFDDAPLKKADLAALKKVLQSWVKHC